MAQEKQGWKLNEECWLNFRGVMVRGYTHAWYQDSDDHVMVRTFGRSGGVMFFLPIRLSKLHRKPPQNA